MSVQYSPTNTPTGNQLIAETWSVDTSGKSCLGTGGNSNYRNDACLYSTAYGLTGLICATNAGAYGLCMCSNDFTCTGVSASSDFYTQCYSKTYYWDYTANIYTCSKSK